MIHPFQAMGCPCEVLLDTDDESIGRQQLNVALQEALRIEKKYSRYLKGNITDAINSSNGKKIAVDEETAGLLDYAAECYFLSDGLFDITTGALRKIWRHFDGRENTVSEEALERVRACVGWERVRWERPFIQLPPGFEIDLGGICKEYAADRILMLLRQRYSLSTLVNLGGDIAAAGEKIWAVGIEDVRHSGRVARTIALRQGGMATSGTTKRFMRVKGETLGHILNPKTGWPVQQAPLSITVTAKTCTEAGFWSTLAMLQGGNAESFLKDQELPFWCYRSEIPIAAQP